MSVREGAGCVREGAAYGGVSVSGCGGQEAAIGSVVTGDG